MKLKIIVHEAEEGGYWAEVPALPGCASQGETVKELLENIKEAIQGYLESREEEQKGKLNEGQIIEIAV